MKKMLLLFSLLISGTFAYAQCGNGCNNGQCGNSYTSNTSNHYYYTSSNYNSSLPSEKIEVAVYPNPTADYIRFEDNARIKGFRIYTINGTMMKDFRVAADAVYPITDLNEGMYVIQFYSSKNKVLNTQRLHKINSRL